MATDKPSKKPSQFMDVSKPGKTAPTASSRPVIVGHKPTVQDPMVNEDSMPPEAHKIDVKRTAPKVVAPLDSAKELEDTKEPSVSEEASEPNVDTAEIPTEDTPPVEQTQDNVVEETTVQEGASAAASGGDSRSTKASKDKGSSTVSAVADQASKGKDKKSDQKIEELEKRQAEIEKLIEDKKYFVHTAQATKKQRKTRWIAIILAFLLLVGAYLAIDAQVIKNDIQLPYEFFKESQKDTANEVHNPAPATSPTEDKSSKQQPLEYENKEFGFGFTIPAEWAALIDNVDEIVYEDLLTESSAGKVYRISVTSKFTGGFVTRDYVPKNPDSSSVSTIGFAAYEACPQGDARFVKTLYQDESTCVVAQAFAGNPDDTVSGSDFCTVLVQRKLNAEKTVGLEFVSAPFALQELSQAGLEQYLKIESVAKQNQLIIDFAKSIRRL